MKFKRNHNHHLCKISFLLIKKRKKDCLFIFSPHPHTGNYYKVFNTWPENCILSKKKDIWNSLVFLCRLNSHEEYWASFLIFFPLNIVIFIYLFLLYIILIHYFCSIIKKIQCIYFIYHFCRLSHCFLFPCSANTMLQRKFLMYSIHKFFFGLAGCRMESNTKMILG